MILTIPTNTNNMVSLINHEPSFGFSYIIKSEFIHTKKKNRKGGWGVHDPAKLKMFCGPGCHARS